MNDPTRQSRGGVDLYDHLYTSTHRGGVDLYNHLYTSTHRGGVDLYDHLYTSTHHGVGFSNKTGEPKLKQPVITILNVHVLLIIAQHKTILWILPHTLCIHIIHHTATKRKTEQKHFFFYILHT